MAETVSEKIKFFDENQKAFFLNIDSSEFEDSLTAHAKNNGLTDDELERLQDMKWRELPEEFKLFAFQYCIIDGDNYNQ